VNYEFIKQPEYAGYWEIVPGPTSFRIATLKKPNWFHRRMVKLCFGWQWHEGKLF
jgi:hypothetical protein